MDQRFDQGTKFEGLLAVQTFPVSEDLEELGHARKLKNHLVHKLQKPRSAPIVPLQSGLQLSNKAVPEEENASQFVNRGRFFSIALQ